VARLIEAQAQEPSANGDDELSAGHPAASSALPTAPAADRPAVP
jgi:hypothetical protein